MNRLDSTLKKFKLRSKSKEPEFNEPFDEWLRSMKPSSTIDSSEAMEEFLVGFRVKMKADVEARRNRPWLRKLAFWR